VLLAIAGISFAYLAVMRTALIEASPSRLEELAQGRRARRILQRRLEREEPLLTTIDTLRAVAGVLFTLSIYVLLDVPLIAIRVTATAAIALLVLAWMNLVGRGGARARPEQLLLRNLTFLCAIEKTFRPLRLAAQAVENAFFRLAGPTAQAPEEKREEEILEVVTEGEREGTIEQEAREMIESVIELRDLDVALLMTPRTEMVSIEDVRSIDRAARLIQESGHSRLPVFHDDRDHIVGILHERDVLAVMRSSRPQRTVADIMRQPHFVPENMRIRGLLKELKAHNTHIAVVLDEYGGTAGIITFSDLVEEIMGEVYEEHDRRQEPEIKALPAGGAEVSGKLRIDELNERLDLRLPEEKSFDTIGGLAESVAGRVPAPGEEFRFQNVKLFVLQADERSVQRLRLEILEEEE